MRFVWARLAGTAAIAALSACQTAGPSLREQTLPFRGKPVSDFAIASGRMPSATMKTPTGHLYTFEGDAVTQYAPGTAFMPAVSRTSRCTLLVEADQQDRVTGMTATGPCGRLE